MFPKELAEGKIKPILSLLLGGGTTLIECKLNNRNAIGDDINPNAVEITKKQTWF